jgi:hypothetical protein
MPALEFAAMALPILAEAIWIGKVNLLLGIGIGIVAAAVMLVRGLLA